MFETRFSRKKTVGRERKCYVERTVKDGRSFRCVPNVIDVQVMLGEPKGRNNGRSGPRYSGPQRKQKTGKWPMEWGLFPCSKAGARIAKVGNCTEGGSFQTYSFIHSQFESGSRYMNHIVHLRRRLQNGRAKLIDLYFVWVINAILLFLVAILQKIV